MSNQVLSQTKLTTYKLSLTSPDHLTSKICTRCKLSKPTTTQHFYKSKLGRFGLSSKCKECQHVYYLQTSGLGRRRRNQPFKQCSNCGQYKERQAFHFSKREKNWVKAECAKCRAKANKLANPFSNRNIPPEVKRLKALDRRRRWYKEQMAQNPEKFRNWNRKRRVALYNAKGKFSELDWLKKFIYYGEKCGYCNLPLTIKTVTKDHKISLKNGGGDWLSNIMPACRPCNGRKGKSNYGEYLQIITNIAV